MRKVNALVDIFEVTNNKIAEMSLSLRFMIQMGLSQKEIEKAHIHFHSQLFSEEPIDLSAQDDLLSSLSYHLSPDQASLCEVEVTLEEIISTVMKFFRAPCL